MQSDFLVIMSNISCSYTATLKIAAIHLEFLVILSNIW